MLTERENQRVGYISRVFPKEILKIVRDREQKKRMNEEGAERRYIKIEERDR